VRAGAHYLTCAPALLLSLTKTTLLPVSKHIIQQDVLVETEGVQETIIAFRLVVTLTNSFSNRLHPRTSYPR